MLGVVLDRRLTFHKHVSMVAQLSIKLFADKSDALVVSIASQLCVVDSSASSVSVADVDLPVWLWT